VKNSIIEIKGLSYRVGRKEILKDISLNVADGEFLSIVGPNGAGKTTLLKCLNRILPCTADSIKVEGKPLAAYHQKELARIVSYVPQAGDSLFPFTVYEFVMMARYPYAGPFSTLNEADRQAVHNALCTTGTEDLAERMVYSLSGGERQKVFVAAALAQDTKILLLDEPTTFLDPRNQAEIHGILWRVNREAGKTVIAATHDVNNAVLMGERILALKEGGIVYCGPSAQIMNNEILERVYGKTFLFVQHPQTGLPIVVPEAAKS